MKEKYKMDIFKKLNDLSNAMTCKYELYDLNHTRLLPGKIVAFINNNELYHGVIVKVNPKSASIKALDKRSTSLYIKEPRKCIVINDLIATETEKQQFQDIYDEYFETKKKNAKNKLYYVAFAYNAKHIDEMGIALFKYQLVDQYHSKSTFNKFLMQNVYQYLENYDLYLLNKHRKFVDINNFSFNDIYKIGIHDWTSLLYKLTENESIDAVFMPINLNISDARNFECYVPCNSANNEHIDWSFRLSSWNGERIYDVIIINDKTYINFFNNRFSQGKVMYSDYYLPNTWNNFIKEYNLNNNYLINCL
jgi:hypothetical protein